MNAELALFLWSVVYGVGMMFLYDLIRGICLGLERGKILIAAGDLCFWIGISVFLFTRLYAANEGILRGFFFLGLLLGMLVYYGTISPWVVQFVSFLIKRLKMMVSWVKIKLRRVLHLKIFTGILNNGENSKKKKEKGQAKCAGKAQ